MKAKSGRRTEPKAEGYLKGLSAIACKVWQRENKHSGLIGAATLSFK
ncbi:MAG: hypothetical protein RMY64_29680 [Nostoc sp. DedQUE08]|nr:hypothetical protein [Nostoc sp. DedQUE08]